MHFVLLEILAIGFLAALALGYVTHRLRLSPIVGYLIAGFIVGPHSPGFTANATLAGQLAEVGVILLMFGVGLHFDLKDLLAVRRIAIPGAVVQSLAATVVGSAVAWAAGLTMSAGLVLGMAISVASTVVLMRVLMDNDQLDTIHGHVAVGWLIVEDIFTVIILVLLPALAVIFNVSEQSEGPGIFSALGMALVKLAALSVLVLFIGGRVIPRLMEHIARIRSRELFTLTVLAVAIAIATVSAELFGTSVALGAFLAGLVVGKTNLSHQAAADVLPMRDAFAVLFFISIGMLFDPAFLVQKPLLILACLGIILIVKPLTAGIVVVALGWSVRTALTVAIGLAQIGEFSFILAQQANQLDLLPAEGFSVLVVCALISIALNPVLFRLVGPAENFLRRSPRLWHYLNRRAESKGQAANLATARTLGRLEATRAIVIGFGPVGRRVTGILREFAIEPVIIDLNVDTVNNLVELGTAAIYGDGGRDEILRAAGIERADYLLITLPDLSASIAAIAHARELNPSIKILVRARFLDARGILENLGVTAISFEEEEVAKAMAGLLVNEVPQKSDW
ncbi:MAG: cation:proton antiporter [Candidatus Sumerlaeia bacterium]